MPISNEEFSRLEAARLNSMHLRKTDQKRILQIAFEHIEDLQGQQKKALGALQAMVEWRNKTLCWRAPAFFAVQWAKVKSWFARGRLETD